VEIKKIIDSGILETYVMGVASEEEMELVLTYRKQYPEVQKALEQVELNLEHFALQHAIEPPAGTLAKIEDRIKEIQLREKGVRKPIEVHERAQEKHEPKSPYIEVESESNHMRVHKLWRWAFAAVFVLGKIFLGFAIYYYLESRQAQQQIEELKLEMKAVKGN